MDNVTHNRLQFFPQKNYLIIISVFL